MKKTSKNTDIKYRPALIGDARQASRLLFETFDKKATFVIGLGNATRAKNILEKLFVIPGHRLSYEYSEMVIYKGRLVGIFTAFPGRRLRKLNRVLYWWLFKQYRIKGKIALIIRGWPLLFIKETQSDEFFLSNLAVMKTYRGRGIGSKILNEIEKRAKVADLGRVALTVSLENKKAKDFYEQHGYAVKAIHLESNKRVPYLGPGYGRMVKKLAD